MSQFIQALFFSSRFYLLWGSIALLWISAYFFPFLHVFAKGLAVAMLLFTIIDLALLFFQKKEVTALRIIDDLLSNGEENKVLLQIDSNFPIPLSLTVIDELPVQFQQRDFSLPYKIAPVSRHTLTYHLRPFQRGEYVFGHILIYAQTALGLVQRRFVCADEKQVKVYPSFLRLRNFQLKAIPERHAATGRRQFRRGISTEFDHVKEYTRGDDARTINWKASARKNQLMINAFMDEKSQQIYCLIDKGRLMKMPFNELTLLDYSINAALMFSYVALQKDDKIGLITFAEKVQDVIQPSKAKKHFNVIMESLYKQETKFLESNYADLNHVVNKRAGQRSLLLLFTNFETFVGFERQLPYLCALHQKHLLCVVLFENTEVSNMLNQRGDNLEDIYVKTIADKFIYEKKMIVKELHKNGIPVVYTKPSNLTVNVVNKYLELKAKQLI